MSMTRIILVVLFATAVIGQDFSPKQPINFSALATRPVQVGTSLPETCAVGQMYFKSDATAGENIFLCPSNDTWVQLVGSGGSGMENPMTTRGDIIYQGASGPSRLPIGTAGQCLSNDGTDPTWSSCGSGSSYTAGTYITITDDVIDVDPDLVCTGEACNVTGVLDASAASQTAPFAIGASDPPTCSATIREFFYNTTSGTLKVCNSTDTWSAVSGGGGLSSITETITLWTVDPGSGNNDSAIIWQTKSGGPGIGFFANQFYGLAFLRGSPTRQAFQKHIKLPATWTGSITFNTFVSLSADSSGTGTVYLEVRTACVTPGTDAVNSLTYNTAQTLNWTFTGSDYNTGKVGTLTLDTTGCSGGDLLFLQIARDPTVYTSDDSTEYLVVPWVELLVSRSLS
jgi:hypothetical protein